MFLTFPNLAVHTYNITVSTCYYAPPLCTPFSPVGKGLAIYLYHVLVVDWRLTILARDASVALIPDLPTIQFFIAYSIQKQREKAWSIFMTWMMQCSVYLGRLRLLLHKHLELQWDWTLQAKLPSHSFCWWPLPPPLSTFFQSSSSFTLFCSYCSYQC